MNNKYFNLYCYTIQDVLHSTKIMSQSEKNSIYEEISQSGKQA